MRVLHVLHSLDLGYGGPIRAVLDLSARAGGLGLESEVLGFGRVNLPDNPLDAGLIHALPVRFPKAYCYSARLRGWLRGNLGRFDGVILHGMWLYPNWAVSEECRRIGVPYACFPHGMLEPWSVFGQGWRKAVKKYAYWHARENEVFNKACCVFFTTEREKMFARVTFPLGRLQLILTPYGVEASSDRVEQPERAELRQTDGRKIGLFLGRVHPKKNVGFLIEAWGAAQLPAEWHLVIAGQGEAGYLAELKALVEEKGLAGQVHFVGHVNGRDKRYLYQRAEWFLLPSNQENFGISVLEAINNGCPVAISDQVYISDMFHEKSEVLPLDPGAWTEFFRGRMQDEGWRAEVIALDRARIAERFKMDSVAERWVSTISGVFGGGEALEKAAGGVE